MVEYVGQQLGNYQLIRLLGEGGFAEVYLGEHIYLGTQAAIKVTRMSLATNEMENFRTEARTIANLVHPNIVRVLEFGGRNRDLARLSPGFDVPQANPGAVGVQGNQSLPVRGEEQLAANVHQTARVRAEGAEIDVLDQARAGGAAVA